MSQTNKEILKEIAYYSHIINQHKNQTLNSYPNFNNKVFVKPPNTFNKYKYVKEQPSTCSTVIIPVQRTVLINPNFKKPSVHINPHFNNNRKIHVNPKVLNSHLSLNSNIENPQFVPIVSPKKIVSISPISLPTRRRSLSLRSTYKIVKSSVLNNHTKSSELPTRKRRISIRSKYKIVKSSCDANKTPNIKTKYKIDRRSVTICNKSLIRKKVTTHGISDILRKNVFKNYNWKKTLVLNQFKSNNTRLTNINGILYNKTQTKLQKIQSTPKQKKNIVFIKGEKYSLASNKKTLKLLSVDKTIRKVKSGKYKQTVNKFVKISNSSLDSTSSRKSRQRNTSQSNKLRKNNQPCPVYRRYGKCRRKDSGRCIFVHNPNQIFLCKKFLQGACVDSDCHLSHKVSLEKMPTCKYYLEGCCVRNDCPYLHVKINPKADICMKFLEGFCDKGSQCNLRHQFLCPNYERSGKCPKRKCLYPHKNKIEKEPNILPERIKNKVKAEEVKATPEISEPSTSGESARYYSDTKSQNSATDEEKQVKCFTNEIIDDLNSSSRDKKSKRPQLGALPSFIPLD